jgi:hypothetical protein
VGAQSSSTSISPRSLPVVTPLLLLAYSLCLARFLALITTPPCGPTIPAFTPPPMTLAPMLLRVFDEPATPPPLLTADDAFEAARCNTSLAITFEREMRGFFAGTTLPRVVPAPSGFPCAGSCVGGGSRVEPPSSAIEGLSEDSPGFA